MTTLLVSFHGGADGINSVIAFGPGEAQRPLTSPASIDAVVHPLRELRRFLFGPDEAGLYVANGWSELNQAVRFAPPEASAEPWHFEKVFADEGISHPFDLVFAFGGKLFVSNQDSGAVTGYNAAGKLERRLEDGFNAVRGLAFDGELLYVADSGNGRVVAYDEELKRAHIAPVSQPVHLLYEPTHRWLLIGSESDDAVYAWSPAQPKSPAVELVAKTNPKIDRTAGMALKLLAGNRGILYVASRKGRQILAFPLDLSGPMPVWSPKTAEVVLGPKELAEEPEFVGIQGGLY